MEGRINPGRVFDRTVGLDEVPDATALWISARRWRWWSNPKSNNRGVRFGLFQLIAALVSGWPLFAHLRRLNDRLESTNSMKNSSRSKQRLAASKFF
jgi:hypothetical protein